jgi:hypothetical protein
VLRVDGQDRTLGASVANQVFVTPVASDRIGDVCGDKPSGPVEPAPHA